MHLLITAFEPFGIRRRLSNENASLQVLERIRQQFGTRYSYLGLPADDSCESRLGNVLEADPPEGVVCLGELLHLDPRSVRVEPAAIRAPLSPWPRFGRGTEVGSVFASSIVCEDQSVRRTGIGLYYCNRVYLHALEWSERHQVPAVFLHIPVFGSRDRHTTQVKAVVDKIERSG